MKEDIIKHMRGGLDTYAKMAKEDGLGRVQRGIALATYLRLRAYVGQLESGEASIEWLIAEALLSFLHQGVATEMEQAPAKEFRERMEASGLIAESPNSVEEIYEQLSAINQFACSIGTPKEES